MRVTATITAISGAREQTTPVATRDVRSLNAHLIYSYLPNRGRQLLLRWQQGAKKGESFKGLPQNSLFIFTTFCHRARAPFLSLSLSIFLSVPISVLRLTSSFPLSYLNCWLLFCFIFLVSKSTTPCLPFRTVLLTTVVFRSSRCLKFVSYRDRNLNWELTTADVASGMFPHTRLLCGLPLSAQSPSRCCK